MAIAPEATPAEATVSASVCTVMPVALPAVAAPMVRPLRVMVKAVLAAIPATAVVMTMAVRVGAAEVAVMVPTVVVPSALFEGAGEVAKNPDGKVRVIFPFKASAVWVVNTRVMATPVLAAIRSPAAMVNATAVV